MTNIELAQKCMIAFGKITSIIAQIEAYKIANLERDRHDYAPAYNEEAFLELSSQLDKVIDELTRDL